MIRKISAGRVSFLGAILGTLFVVACGAGVGEQDSATDPESLSASCSLSVTTNTYDGPNYWGTMAVKNAGPQSASGYVVAFDVPSGAHCTNDTVPSGAKLSPLTGSGTSAATTSNHCVFTFTGSLAKSATKTFNYSTDSASFSKATNAVASSASCGSSGAGGSGAGGASGSAGSGATAGTSSGTAGSTATSTCGCNGKSGCAVWDKVFMTWYGFNDNSCATEGQHGCNDIANPGLGPKKHSGATEGKGTYDDPITAAASDETDSGHSYESSGGVTLTPGTIIYNPEVKKYFIMEDSCLECGDEYECKLSKDDTDDPKPSSSCKVGSNLHIDFWMGPSTSQDSSDLETCEDDSTIGDTYAGTGTVIVNPPTDLPVVTTALYTGSGSGGSCWTKKDVGSFTCK